MKLTIEEVRAIELTKDGKTMRIEDWSYFTKIPVFTIYQRHLAGRDPFEVGYRVTRKAKAKVVREKKRGRGNRKKKKKKRAAAPLVVHKRKPVTEWPWNKQPEPFPFTDFARLI